MGRPKAFDRDQALDQAVQLFWAQGYDATSMSDLRKAMGIGRQSLYDTFGDKQQLFGEVLDRYIGWNDEILAVAFPADAGVDALRQHLYRVVHTMTDGAPRKGCLLMRTCNQVAPHDDRVAARTQAALQSMTDTFRRVLEGAQSRGEISGDVDPTTAGRYLTSQAAGLGVLAQSGATATELKAVVDTALNGLTIPDDRR